MPKAKYVYVPNFDKDENHVKQTVTDTIEFEAGALLTTVIDAILAKVGHMKYYVQAFPFIDRIPRKIEEKEIALDGVEIVIVAGGKGIP